MWEDNQGYVAVRDFDIIDPEQSVEGTCEQIRPPSQMQQCPHIDAMSNKECFENDGNSFV